MSGAIAKSVRCTIPLEKFPRGTFKGTWGGHVARTMIDGVEYQLTTDIGIRTPMAACVITHDESGITVETEG